MIVHLLGSFSPTTNMIHTPIAKSYIAIFVILMTLSGVAVAQRSTSFTLDQIKSYPFPNELTTASTGSRIAWALDERGLRNIWVAEGPEFKPRRLTNYNTDDGQELTSLSISADGKYVVYVRGGDHGSNFDDSGLGIFLSYAFRVPGSSLEMEELDFSIAVKRADFIPVARK